ncbi:hypothetical protein B4U80_02158 [Leptotrombidium deliense]|uniref:Signal recognition particle receptor subunit beta n=1 Tax=Leptotrombidium deliense TaxID=299467 RepID=A0A443SGI5_9ACAR|nr:hypothetical protein B4U80_02158 [Leptotrombidium deliense]
MHAKKSVADSYLNIQYLMELQKDPNFTLYAALLAVFVILLSIIIIRLLFGKSKSGKNILIVGLSDAGKTLIFTRLISERFVKTVTSMNKIEAEISVNNKNVTVVDLPGFDRLRQKFWDDFKNGALAVMFVVDSSQFMTNLRDVAEFLYCILTDPVMSKRKLPLLIACNKQDAPKAKASKVIQNQLEKEINAIRETKKSALSFTDDSDVARNIGDSGKDFQFSDLKFKIEFVDCNAVGKDESESDLSLIWRWMSKVV